MYLSGVKLEYSWDESTWEDGSVTFKIHSFSCIIYGEELRRDTYAADYEIDPVCIKRIRLRFVIDSDELNAGGQPFSQDASALAKWKHIQEFDAAPYKRIDTGTFAVDGFDYFKTATPYTDYELVNEDGPTPPEEDESGQIVREYAASLISRKDVT